MDVGFADDGDALVIEQGVGGTGHDAQFPLQGVPALDGSRLAVVFGDEPPHGYRQPRNVAQLVVGDFHFHLFPAVGHGFFHLGAVGNGFFHLGGQFGQRHGGQLHAEPLQQFPFVADGGPEIKGPGADLQNADLLKGTHHVAHRQKIFDAPGKDRVGEAAVGQVGKGHAEPPQHLAGGKQAALGIPQAGAVRFGALVQGAPQQYRYLQVLGQPGAEVLGAKVAVGQQQAVHTGSAEFCQHFQPVFLAVQQALLVDIVNVHKVHPQLPQALGGKIAVFYGVGRRKDAAPGRGVGQFDGSHTQSLFLFIVGPGSGYPRQRGRSRCG